MSETTNDVVKKLGLPDFFRVRLLFKKIFNLRKSIKLEFTNLTLICFQEVTQDLTVVWRELIYLFLIALGNKTIKILIINYIEFLSYKSS